MSDMLRYLTLWKYGGIYLDLDVVVISSLENLTNFAGAEDWDDVAAGVMGFDTSELGRRIADACVRDFKKNFRGDVWGNNGPGVITRTLQKLCGTINVSIESSRDCSSSPFEKDRDVCGRRSDMSLRLFDQRATESIRGNGIDAYPVERAFTHFSA